MNNFLNGQSFYVPAPHNPVAFVYFSFIAGYPHCIDQVSRVTVIFTSSQGNLSVCAKLSHSCWAVQLEISKCKFFIGRSIKLKIHWHLSNNDALYKT